MKNLKQNKFELIVSIYLIVSLITIFLGSVLATYRIFNLQIYSYIIYALGIIGIFVIVYSIIIKKFKINKIDLIILLLTLFGIISVIFSKDVHVSLYGRQGRCEGLYMIITYYIMFVISSFVKNKSFKEIIINVILITGSLNVIYGLLQITDYSGTFMNSWLYAKAFVGNSIFFSSYNVMCLGLSLGMYLFGKNKCYLAYVMIFSIGLFSTGAMSGLVGLIVMLIAVIVFIVYFKRNNKSEKKSYICKGLLIVAALFLSYFFVAAIGRGHYNEDVKEMVNQTVSMVKDKRNDDSFGTERLYIWKNAMKYAPQYLLHGVGIDMFTHIAPYPLILPISKSIVDKAHNEYLQILITEGIFALVSYLTLLFMIFFNSIKRIFKSSKMDNELVIALFLAFFGYIAQAFFNISICRVAPIFYIIMGLLYSRNNQEQ